MIVNLLIKMKKILYISGILTFFVLMSFMYVDFFSSMTKVDYIDGSKTLKFTTKMNTSHISDAIKINPNTILLSAFPKQINLVNIAYKGSQKTMNFQRGKEVNEVSF